MTPREAAAPAGRKQLSHERIVDTAARVLRESGFAGVGVADIMKRAGLTHGGFYAHFASRDALLAEALERAGEDSRTRLRRSIEAG
jgi:TetR/AcrR family transcriptional regulator, transcriptional repressor for nem operon